MLVVMMLCELWEGVPFDSEMVEREERSVNGGLNDVYPVT